MSEKKSDKILKDLLKKFEALKKEMSAEDLKLYRETDEDELGMFHHSLGMHIRNEWGLWGDSELSKFFTEKFYYHPDDMSGVLLDLFHQYLNGKEISLDIRKGFEFPPK